MGKISKKKLSRNLRTKKSPLKVLPLVTNYSTRRRFKIAQKKLSKTSKEEKISTLVLRTPAIHCPIKEVSSETIQHLKKNGRKKLPLKILPFTTARGTMKTLRWIFVLIFFYLAAGIMVAVIQEGFTLMKNILIYSVMGFFTFFMGYIGTIIARDILEIISTKKHSRDEADVEA